MGIVCQYCNSNNPENEKQCVACGAPLPLRISAIAKPDEKPLPVKPIRKENSVELATKAVRVYNLFWLAIFDAIIIFAVSFSIGLSGGIFNQPALGVIGATILGISVGITIKGGVSTLISAPLGLLIGSFLIMGAMIFNLPTQTYIIILSLCTSIAAVLGGIVLPIKLRSIWQKIRPFLGAAGGFIFGLLGISIGIGLQFVYTNWFK